MSTEHVNEMLKELAKNNHRLEELMKNISSTKVDYEASLKKLSEVSNLLEGCKYKELIENPKTGEYFYHLLTKNDEEIVLEIPYTLACVEEHQKNCRIFREYKSKILDEVNQTMLDVAETCSEQIKNMSELIGSGTTRH